MRGRLAMRAEACGLPRRSLRVALYGVAIAGADRMMHQPRKHSRPIGGRRQRRQHRSVQLLHAQQRQRLQHGESRQLVTESKRAAVECEQTGLHCGRQSVVRRRDGRAHQLDFRSRRDDRHQIDDVARFGREAGAPCEDRFAYSRGHRVIRPPQQFGHEERIAARQTEDGARVVRAAREPGDRIE